MHIDRKLALILEQPVEALDQFIEVNRRSVSKAVTDSVDKANNIRAYLKNEQDVLGGKKKAAPKRRGRSAVEVE